MSTAGNSLMAVLASLVVLLSVYFWAAVLPRLFRNEPLLPPIPRRAVPWGLFDLIVIVLVAITLESLIAPALCLFGIDFPRNPNVLSARELALLKAGQCVVLPFAVYFLRLRHSATQTDMGMRPGGWGGQVGMGIAAFTMLAVPVYTLSMLLALVLPYRHPVVESLLAQGDIQAFLFAALAVVIVAPLVEEFLFRVLLQGWLENLFGAVRDRLQAGEIDDQQAVGWLLFGRPAAAASADLETPGAVSTDPDPPAGHSDERISSNGRDQKSTAQSGRGLNRTERTAFPYITSAFTFAVMHSGHGAAPVSLFLLALGLGYMYQRTGRILPCIVVHMLINGVTMLSLFLMRE